MNVCHVCHLHPGGQRWLSQALRLICHQSSEAGEHFFPFISQLPPLYVITLNLGLKRWQRCELSKQRIDVWSGMFGSGSVMTGPGLFSKHGPVLVYATANYLHQITLFPPFAPQHVCLLHVCFLAFNKSHLNVVQENGIISCTTIGCAAAETYLRKMSHNLDNDSCE